MSVWTVGAGGKVHGAGVPGKTSRPKSVRKGSIPGVPASLPHPLSPSPFGRGGTCVEEADQAPTGFDARDSLGSSLP
jgi:hypothetical protein